MIYLDKNLKIKDKLKEEVEFIPKLKSNNYLKIGILNLMPSLEDTERDLLRVLDVPTIEVKVDFIYLDSKKTKDDKLSYYEEYYHSFKEIKNNDYDGIIITGAPLEHIPYSSVSYVQELKEFFKYTKKHTISTIFLCWASLFGLQYFYGINRKTLNEKASGLYEHYLVNRTNLVKGFDDKFYIPQSRYCSIIEDEITGCEDLILVSKANETGPYIVEDTSGSKIFLTGHAEYDLYTLDNEYKRDINKGLKTNPPKNYYQNGKPEYKWKAHATLLYHNWLYYYLYKKKFNNL